MTTCEDKKWMLRILFGTMNPCAERVVDQFATAFTLFAFFPSMFKKLPESGGWLDSVKVVPGFTEVTLGMKFLSAVGQTYHREMS